MKQTYMKPETTITFVQTQQQLLAGSFTMNGSGDLTGGTLQSGNATGAALGRRNSVWDDEDE